ncbi:MAG: MATE family efflux transporter [Firmicutes bacterium]|nr:MATE family efflux transporter [Bacillota bacterium]
MNTKNHLEEKSIPALLWLYARPSMFASLITGLYGIIDGIFIGQKMGPEGIAAITLAFPITSLLIGLGVLLSIGTSILVNKNTASGNHEMAKTYIFKGRNLFLLFAFITTIGTFFAPQIMSFLGKGTNAYIVDLSQSFVSVLLLGSVIYLAPIFLNDILKNLGKPREAMFAMIAGTITNIILDYIFIFIFNMELVGAALATITGQLVATLVILLFIRKHNIWKVKRNKYHIRYRSYLNIIKTGSTSFIIQISTMLILIIHNRLFLQYGHELYVSSFGIIGYALTAFWLLINGFVGGSQPIISFNHAIDKGNRVRKTVKISFIFIIAFSTFFSLLFYIFPEQIISIFSQHDPQLFNITKHGFYLVMYALPFAGINVLVAMYFQSIGKSKTSIFLAVSRVLFFMLPLILILPKTFGVNGIYLIVPLSEVGTAIVSILFIRYNLNKGKVYFSSGRQNVNTNTEQTKINN